MESLGREALKAGYSPVGAVENFGRLTMRDSQMLNNTATISDRGGLTGTHLLQPGSSAIDGGTAIGCPPTDQRGVRRPQGQACDVGAVEMRPTELVNYLYLPLISRQTDP